MALPNRKNIYDPYQSSRKLNTPLNFQFDRGWSPVLIPIVDGNHVYLQLYDWLGGEGDKPFDCSLHNYYLGATGYVTDITLATDIVVAGLGPSAFIGLTDCPSSYIGKENYVPIVNSTEDALEFVPFTFLELKDVSNDHYVPDFRLKTTLMNTVDFIDDTLLNLNDVNDTSYTGKDSYVLTVDETNSYMYLKNPGATTSVTYNTLENGWVGSIVVTKLGSANIYNIYGTVNGSVATNSDIINFVTPYNFVVLDVPHFAASSLIDTSAYMYSDGSQFGISRYGVGAAIYTFNITVFGG